MKKVFLSIFAFAIFSFLATGILIDQKINIDNLNGKIEKNDNIDESLKEENNNSIEIKEKTIDLNGTYDQNDLKIESTPERIMYVATPINIPTISGLKNKDIETKINNDMRERIINKFNENINKYTQVGHIDSYVNVFANFANVISIEVSLRYQENGKYKSENIFLNYELVNGEKLKFEDLFVKDADLNSIVRKVLYRALCQQQAWNFEYYDIEFDKEKEEWTALTWKYDEETGGNEYRDIYIPEINEYEIYKAMNKFMKSDEKQFSFDPTRLYLEIKDTTYDYGYYIDFIDIAKDVVIYDKYLTDESIFENEKIGMKNIWTCSKTTNTDNRFLEYGFAENNLFYEISEGYLYIDNNYPFNKAINILNEQWIEEARNVVQEYKKIAKSNPDKFYILYLNQQLHTRDNINMISTSLSEKTGCTNIVNKDKILENLKDSYRYYNVGFYGSGMGLFLERATYEESYVKIEKNEEVQNKLYDARNLKQINYIGEIFKENVDYINILKQKAKEKAKTNWYYENLEDEKINELVEKASYMFDIFGIFVKFGDEKNEIFISYDDIENSLLNIYNLDPIFILPSNTRLIEKSEIQNLSLDELNKAYNEIFARHGHSFNNKELKEYFENQSWYYPVEGKTVILEELNEIERENLDIIKNVIDEKKK